LPADAHFVLIRFSSLGDVVKGTALPRLIKRRYPQAHVTWVTSEAYLELIRDNPHVDRAIGFERRHGLAGLRALGQELNAGRVDLVVDIHRSLRSRLLARGLRAPRVTYSKRTWQRLLLIHWGINTYREPRRKEDDFLATLAPYGVTDDGAGTELFTARLAADPLVQERLAPLLTQIAAWRQAGRPVVGMAPMAAWDLKRWPLASFHTLLRALRERAGAATVVFGGPGDTDAEALAGVGGDGAISAVGRTSHLESAYLASLLDLVIANDTGMSHLAEAVGTDALVLFGPTTREWGYFPSRATSVVVERELYCRPCTRMGEGRCTHPVERACLTGISPETVASAVLQHPALRRRGGGGPGRQAADSA
jgi:heptosyltransferase-2